MFTELDLAVSCLHPTVISVAHNNILYLENRYRNVDIISKILSLVKSNYDTISRLPAGSPGMSQVQFDAALLSLNLGESTNKVISQSYEKCLKYNDEDLHAIKDSLSQIITNEMIGDTKMKHMNSPVDFVKAIKEFNVDNIVDIDQKIYRESRFTDIDITKLDTEIKNGGVLKSSIPMINACSPLGGYVDRTLTAISGKPGSGKSFFSIQEAINFVMNGKKVLYTALGDMGEFHFVTRIAAILLKRSLTEVTINFKYYYELILTQYPQLKNLLIQYFLPDEVSCSDWLSDLKKKGYYDEFDVFIVDYDTNFKSEEDMYQKGETTYNLLKGLADRPGKYVFVCCQPKECYYGEEIIPMQAMAESSRKPQICDNIITISQPPSPGNVNHIGILNVAKYRGGSPASCPYLMDKNGRFEPITLEMYNYLKVTRDSVTLAGSGCESSAKVLSDDLVASAGSK